MSGFFGGTQLHGIPVFYRMHCFNGTIQSQVSTTLKLSPRLSFIPIQLQVYILELLHSHFIKLQPRLDSKRNRRWRRLETKPVEIITKHCLLLFAPSIKRYLRNRIASKYHYHASAYSLQTIDVAVLFIYTKKTQTLTTRTTRADCPDEREIL